MYPSLNNNIHSQLYQHPSPIYNPLDEAALCEFFQQQQFLSNDHNHNIPPHDMSNNVEFEKGQNATKDGHQHHFDFNNGFEVDNDSPRKIPSKGDRHSKINTARGLRDRRMRLSLDVAKKFFWLQDLLGYDKASTTIDWLLTKSKTDILDLLPDRSCGFMDVSKSNSTSSTSECEVVSGIGDDQATTKSKAKSCSESSKKQKEKARKCVDFQHPLAKETRVRARQRARERTIEKQKKYENGVGQNSTFGPFLDQVTDEDVNKLGCWSTFQFNQGFVGESASLLMSGNCTPSYFLDYQHI